MKEAKKVTTNQILDAVKRGFDLVDKKFVSVDKRFESMDKRFESMDKRFDSMDERFDSMDKRFDSMDKRFDSMDGRIESIDKRLTKVEATMVTKNYLDEKLADLRGDLVVLTRKEDKKVIRLVDVLHRRKVISTREADEIMAMEPFPELSLRAKNLS